MTVQEARCSVAQVGAASPPPVPGSFPQSGVNRIPTMNHLCQLDGVVDLSLVCLLHADQGDPGRLTPWVQLERHGLYLARLNVAIREPNNERRLAMDHGSFPGEQEPCSFLSAGHQGLMMLVEYKHTHDVRSFLSP